MSILIERLRELSGAKAQPIGFGQVKASSPKPRPAIVAYFSLSDTSKIGGCVAGADAGLLPLKMSKVVEEVVGKVPDIPWGIRVGDGVEGIEGKPFDFILFSEAAPFGHLKGEKRGRILELSPSVSDNLIRAVDQLPIDAIFVAEEVGDCFSWRHLMVFQRISALTDKPLLVRSPLKVTRDELEALWEVGINGIVVEADKVGEVGKLRQMIEGMSFPKQRRGRREVVLPYFGKEVGSVAEEEEEEEEHLGGLSA